MMHEFFYLVPNHLMTVMITKRPKIFVKFQTVHDTYPLVILWQSVTFTIPCGLLPRINSIARLETDLMSAVEEHILKENSKQKAFNK